LWKKEFPKKAEAADIFSNTAVSAEREMNNKLMSGIAPYRRELMRS
jgi:hypothetical protein